MCSYAAQETQISRVVFSIVADDGRAIQSGMCSRYRALHALPEVFGSVPEVIGGMLRKEAEEFGGTNPLVWSAIKLRGYLGGE
jgi:tRNA(Arg) A34 adenosine deaminase TadA